MSKKNVYTLKPFKGYSEEHIKKYAKPGEVWNCTCDALPVMHNHLIETYPLTTSTGSPMLINSFRRIIRSMRNEYYMWRACQWVYRNTDYHICQCTECSKDGRVLAAQGEPMFLFRKKAVNAKMARFLFLAEKRGYLHIWICKTDKLSYATVTDEGLEFTNHILLVPTGLILLLIKKNKVLMTIVITALVGAISQLSIYSFVKSLIGRI